MSFLSELFGRFGVLEWAGILLSVVLCVPFIMSAIAVSRHKREMRKRGANEFAVWMSAHHMIPDFGLQIAALGVWSATLLAICSHVRELLQ